MAQDHDCGQDQVWVTKKSKKLISPKHAQMAKSGMGCREMHQDVAFEVSLVLRSSSWSLPGPDWVVLVRLSRWRDATTMVRFG